MHSIARIFTRTGRRLIAGGNRNGLSTTARRLAVDWPARIAEGPSFKDFLVAGKNLPDPKHLPSANDFDEIQHPYLLDSLRWSGQQRKVYFEVYGCQMNVSDTEIVWAILQKADYVKVDDIRHADVVLLITCAIREGAETKVFTDVICTFNKNTKCGYFLDF